MIAIGEYTISALNDLDYYEVTSSDSMVVIEDENFTPEAVTFTSKHRLGNGNLEAYSGRFKIETSKDGETWETKYTSSGNESSKTYELPSALEDKVPYLFRKSVGGDRAIEEIVGGSVVWNQLINPSKFVSSYGITASLNGEVISFSGTSTAGFTGALGRYSLPTNHICLLLYRVIANPNNVLFKCDFNNDITGKRTTSSSCIAVASGSNINIGLANYTSGTVLDGIQIKVIVTDLTTMFGTQIADYIYSLEQSTAGAGVSKLKEWGFFTEDYYEYCEPTLKSVEGLVSKKTVGFNQWDEEWEVGMYNIADGQKSASSTRIRCKNLIPVLPSTEYCFMKPIGMATRILFYDENETWISSPDEIYTNWAVSPFTSPSNARYMTFHMSRTTYNHDICINLSDPTKNGTYEPYESHTYSLDSTLTLRGVPKLDSNNNLYYDGDIYPADGNGSRRYGLVDLGTLNWGGNSSYYYAALSNYAKTKKASSELNNAMIAHYTQLGYEVVNDSSGTFGINNAGTYVKICDTSYTDAASFKTAMSGIYLLYELATPTTFTATPYHNPQIVGDTEEFVTTGIVPVGHDTKYPANIKNIRCSLYKPNETPSATTLLDQITVPIVSGLQHQPFVQRTVFEWALSSSSTKLDENTIWAEQKPKPTQAQPYLWERSRNDYSNGTHTYSDAHCDITISGVISDVDNVKGQITNKVWQSDITTSINSYDGTTVSNIRDRVSTTEQNLTGITTRVGAVESTTSGLSSRMTAAESSISQNADNIELKVSKNGVISSINQSSESITISADKVNIAGSTAFTSLNSQVTAIQNETNQKSELIRGTQTAGTYSWTGTSTTISQLTDGMEIRYWLPFSVAGGTVSGSYSYYDGSQTTTGTNSGVGLTLTLKNGTMTEEIPVYYGSMTRLTSHYGYGNIIRMIYRENVRVNNGNSTYYTVAKGFWCDANYDTNSNYVQYSTGVTSGATNGVYQYSLIMRDTANTWVSIATTNGTGTSKSAYTGGLYYDKVLYHSSGTNYASNKTTSTVYDSIGFDLRYSTNCGTTLTNRKPVYLVGTINNTDKRFYLDTTQWYTQTVPTSADGKTYIYIGEAYSSYQVWLATENKAYQYYNGRFITLEEIKDLEAMTWINSTGQNAADIIANWATDATSATTTINGGLIQTHTIQASHLATNAIMSNNYQASQNTNSPYSITGSFLDLNNGNFYTPNFGLDNVNGNAYFNGEITATSGQIGDDTSNHWQIGTVVDFNGNQSAAIESNGTSYIQSGDWMISNNRIDTRHYDNQRKYTYLYEDGVYWDFGLHTPSLTSNNAYENNFIYIRNHESTIPTLEGAWNYVFRVDRNGMIYINGVSLDDKYASIDGVSGAYLPMTGGNLTGNLSVGGNLSVTGTVSGLKNLSINGKTYNGSSAVTVGTIGAAYGGTGQTSLINSANALINALDTGSSTPVDNDYYISQYVNGGTTTKTYHRRPMSALWLYIKGKINADTDLYTDKFVPKTGGEFTGAVTVSDALIADEITSGNLIVNGVGRFTNGIYGDLTGNVVGTASKAVGDENGLNIASNYLRLSGGTMTGHLTVPTIKVNSIVNEGYAHRIDFGRPSVNQMDFYEYGGVFNFYWNTSTTSTENATLLGKITTNGWEGNVVGNVTGNASTATKATQDSDGNTISSTYVKKSGDTMTGVLTLKGNLYTDGYTGGLNANNSNIYGVNGIYFADTTDSPGEYINFYRDSTHVDSLYASSGKLYFSPNRELTKTGSIYKVLIEGDTIPESSLIWGNKAFTADYSMGDVFLNDYLRANRFAGVKASAITIEYSSDGGSTWNDYQTNDLLKRSLFTTSSGYHIGGSSSGTVTANSQLRITLDFTEGSIYTNLRKIMIYVSTNYSQNCKVTITASKGTSPNDYSLIVCENQSIAGWSGWNIIPCNFNTYGNTDSANSQYQRIRFVFTNSGLSDTSRKGGLQICRIYGYGGVGWSTPSNLALTGHVYTYDGNLNATFPAQLTATQFNGNATSASKLNSTRSFTIGKTAKNVDWSGAVSFSQAEISDNASTSAAGWMSKDDKTKLNGIEANAQVNTITGVKGGSETTYRTGDVNITASNIGLGNLTNNKQVKGLSSGTTSGHLVTWGSDGYTVADSGIAKGSVTTKITLSGSDYSASSNTITITKANLQSAVQDTSLVLMTAAERSKLSSIQVSEGGTIDFSGVTASAPITATVNETTKAVNITHNTSGVTQGTYRSVTVNTYGHVTAGTNPTTLSGYGITDAKIASGVITLGSNTITPLTASSTLDATKLSGTASIDTTGNATTATTASKLGSSNVGASDRPIYLSSGTATQTTYRMAATNVSWTTARAITEDLETGIWYVSGTNSTDLYSQSDGAAYVNKYSNSWIAEIYQDYRTGQIAVRGKNNGTWKAWRKVLDSSNYTDYTVTKTGTGASGTWGIGISGNATTATKFSSNRSIALTGDVIGSASSNGENGWSIATIITAITNAEIDTIMAS